jgi:hypothetical protein
VFGHLEQVRLLCLAHTSYGKLVSQDRSVNQHGIASYFVIRQILGATGCQQNQDTNARLGKSRTFTSQSDSLGVFKSATGNEPVSNGGVAELGGGRPKQSSPASRKPSLCQAPGGTASKTDGGRCETQCPRTLRPCRLRCPAAMRQRFVFCWPSC